MCHSSKFGGFLRPVRFGSAQQPASHLAVVLLVIVAVGLSGSHAVAANPAAGPTAPAVQAHDPPTDLLDTWAGLHVAEIRFEGVPETLLKPLPGKLPQQPGQPLDPQKVRNSLRRLYATGLYRTIDVSGVRAGQDVSIVFTGEPALFVGGVTIDGIKSDRLTQLLEGGTQLQLGELYSPERAEQASVSLESTLEDSGFYKGAVSKSLETDHENSLVHLTYTVDTGKAARVGKVTVQGTSGMTEKEFRRKAKLKLNSRVTRNTVNRALSSLHKTYIKRRRMTATISLASKQYDSASNRLNYTFLVHEGPVIDVKVEGGKVSRDTLRKLIPVFEEGAFDEDLLNEGARNLRSYFQGQGYFDAKVTHRPVHTSRGHITALYIVDLGARHLVSSVAVAGNHYFSKDLILQRISIRPKSLIARHGLFSQQMVRNDVGSIEALYQANGFSDVKVTPKVIDLGREVRGREVRADLKVTYEIDEGPQQRIGKYRITGATPEQKAAFEPYLNTQVGQPYSASNLDGDRDTILTYFLSQGYGGAEVNLSQQADPGNKNLVDADMDITPGRRFFVRKVLVHGLHYTRPSVVNHRIALDAGDPLNETALLETQRKLYNLALFNEVNIASQNPEGDEVYKNVLLNVTEAKRWDFNYGFGFEAQTGTPSQGCLSVADQDLLGTKHYNCTPNGHFGASPRILFDVSRTNLRGTDQSITLRTNYGTLEQLALITYQDPHMLLFPNVALSLSGGYNSSAYISTYRAAILSGALRFSQQANRANHLIYSFSYRRVSVDANTLQVSLAEIPLLAQPVRVGGPGIAWIRDTRDVPLDSHRGSFTSVEQFFANSDLGSQADFNRIDMTNATYYQFGRDHWVFARQTRYGQERAFGEGDQRLIPLPERLYAGGANSHRGFALNSAGPRDPQTGYPIGGAGVFVNTSELRTPAPALPWVGENLSFVLFHDMGNVFQKSSDIWPSFFRVHQPHSGTCHVVIPDNTKYNTPTTCDFNDFSHAVGMGLRYHTPVGPVRVDFSYNLNPPIYPVIYDYTTDSNSPNPHVSQAPHFNFFFSIGQSF